MNKVFFEVAASPIVLDKSGPRGRRVPAPVKGKKQRRGEVSPQGVL